VAIPPADIAWSLPRGVAIDRRTWDGESVVFNRASGETHLLDAFSDWVLREIEAGPTSLAALTGRAVALEMDAGPAEARLREALAVFEREGLAERRQE
jgi:PqqD family protein of HPr-rel-A system